MTGEINYKRVERSIKYLAEHVTAQPSLEEMAAQVHLSPYHFQRLFTQWAGISPKKFLQYLTVEELKRELGRSHNLIQAAESVGLTAQSRVYDLFVNIEAVTPQEFRTHGEGIEIEYGLHPSPFGTCLIANTPRGICALEFLDDGEEEVAIARLKGKWFQAGISRNQSSTLPLVRSIFHERIPQQDFRLLVRGTKFQIKVWEALLRIPFGAIVSYQTIAQSMRRPSALRAIGSAIGQNPVAFLIPCHRVIRKEGLIGEYHWGQIRKRAIIGWEKGRLEQPPMQSPARISQTASSDGRESIPRQRRIDPLGPGIDSSGEILHRGKAVVPEELRGLGAPGA